VCFSETIKAFTVAKVASPTYKRTEGRVPVWSSEFTKNYMFSVCVRAWWCIPPPPPPPPLEQLSLIWNKHRKKL
jgi:hypothetical protein